MATIDIGQQVVVTMQTKVAGVLTAPTTLTLTIHPPSGSDTVISLGSMTVVVAGQYTYNFTPIVGGHHLLRVVATGAVVAALDGHDPGGYFDVNPLSF